MRTKIYVNGLTDTGNVRPHNEDNFIVSPDLKKGKWHFTDHEENLSSAGSMLVVADGMGGMNAGEVASLIAIESIKQFCSPLKLPKDISPLKARGHLKKAILYAHDNIVKKSQGDESLTGMGTTIIVAWIIQGKAIISWCGDSRGYLYREENGLNIITRDHSLVWDFVEAGKLTPEEADEHPHNNIITQSLGSPNSRPRPDFVIITLEPKDKILLCSDGLNNMVNQNAIEAIVKQDKSLAEINFELVQLAKCNGGLDNITSLLVELKDENKRNTGNSISPLLLLTGFLLLFAFLYFQNSGISFNVKSLFTSLLNLLNFIFRSDTFHPTTD